MAKDTHMMIRVTSAERAALKVIAGDEGVSAYLLRKGFEGQSRPSEGMEIEGAIKTKEDAAEAVERLKGRVKR